MLYTDQVVSKKFTRSLERVLIADPYPAASRLMMELLKDLGGQALHVEPSLKGAMAAALKYEPQIIFTEFCGPLLDGPEFVWQLRRSDMACRKAPVVMVTNEATANSILAARDAGVHEFLRKPYTIKDLERRIEAVAGKSRDWVEAVRYVGPDRRRFNSAEYQGHRKRKTDAKVELSAGRIDQALRILRSGVRAIDSDPRQALRAMQAQAADLARIAADTGDTKLSEATERLRRALDAQSKAGALNGADLQAACQPLWAWLLASAFA